MPKVPYLITNFRTGEVSRKVEGNIGSQFYQSALRTAKNVFVLPHGGLDSRPGTIYVGTTENIAEKARLFPFERPNGDSYVIEMTRSNARFYKDGVRLTGGTTDIDVSAVTSVTLTDAQLFDLHYQQVDDVMYFTCSRNVVRSFKITYTSDTSWAASVYSTTGVVLNDTIANAFSVISLHEQRLVFGAPNSDANRILGSIVNDIENLSAPVSANPDDGWDYDYQGQGAQWLLSWTGLLMGTTDDEWSWGQSPITPTTLPNLKTQSRNGSSRVQPVLMQNTGAFVQSGGQRVREIVFSNDLQAYTAPDLTRFADHISGTSGIVRLAFQTNPASALWAVRADGKVAILNIQEDGTKAWSTVETRDGDEIEDVCVIRQGTEDQVWQVVKRSINGSTTRYIEYYNVRDFGTDQADAIYMDSVVTFDGGATQNIEGITNADPAVVTITGHGLTTGDRVRFENVGGMTELNTLHGGIFHITNTGANTFSLQDPDNTGNIDSTGFGTYTSGGTIQVVKKTIDGLLSLEGETCGVLVDGGVHPDRTPDASGEIELQEYHNVVQVGLKYTVDIEPVPIEPPEAAGRTANLARLRLKVYNTLNAQAGPDEDNLKTIVDGPTVYGTPPALFTGVKKLTITGKYACPATLLIRQDDPLPITLLGISCDVEINDVV